MAQTSLYVLFGHGYPLQKGNLTYVPDNGTMIKMIPGTCTPAARSIELIENMTRVPNTPPAEFVEILNEMGPWKSKGIDKMNHPAFTIYAPGSIYSDSQIANEASTKLSYYHYDDAAKVVSSYDMTDVLHEHLKKKTHRQC